MIGIVDYGLGNVRAFENIYRRLGIPAKALKTENELVSAERLILPGVGAFDWAMERLSDSGMVPVLNQRVLDDKIPVLGVCVGMQIMAERSDEGNHQGLGWIPAEVRHFDESLFDQKTHLPHMGWNDVTLGDTQSKLFDGICDPQFYFLHSYFFDPKSDDYVIGLTDYGTSFVSAINKENIWATQFHPEKSLDWGMRLLKNFAEI